MQALIDDPRYSLPGRPSRAFRVSSIGPWTGMLVHERKNGRLFRRAPSASDWRGYRSKREQAANGAPRYQRASECSTTVVDRRHPDLAAGVGPSMRTTRCLRVPRDMIAVTVLILDAQQNSEDSDYMDFLATPRSLACINGLCPTARNLLEGSHGTWIRISVRQ
jgi:hypothetical protein